jgi:hypothetical protein
VSSFWNAISSIVQWMPTAWIPISAELICRPRSSTVPAGSSLLLTWHCYGNVPLVESQVASLRTSGSDFGFVRCFFHLFYQINKDKRGCLDPDTNFYSGCIGCLNTN